MADAKKPTLTINPLKPADVPSEEAIIAEAKALIESSTTWQEGKTYSRVKTFSRPKGPGDGAAWHCRLSEHTPDEVTFELLWDKLGKDKAHNEMKFVHEIYKVQNLKVISPTASIWALYYKFTPPVSPRTFVALQVVFLDESSPRTGYVISIPMDISGETELPKLEDKNVRGRYVSVERIMELENGNTEWRMATSSTPGGSIPTFIVESTLPKQVAADVPKFLKWIQTLPK